MRGYCVAHFARLLVPVVLLALAGCGSGGSSTVPAGGGGQVLPPPSGDTDNQTPDPTPDGGGQPSGPPAAPSGFSTVALIPFRDAWPDATPRWMDIGDWPFATNFQEQFDSSGSGALHVAYNPDAASGVLETRVWAQGLKPNFCYQIKLVGKPGSSATGAGLWGSGADMASNSQILLAGRYWDYATETPHFNTTDRASVVASDYYKAGWVAGYLLLGCFVTNATGGTSGWVALDGDDGLLASHGSYHVVWKSGQGIPANSAGPYVHTINRMGLAGSVYPTSFMPPEAQVALYLEREPGVAQPYRLGAGSYDVVLMLTEESFHSAKGSAGGYWYTARVSDWSTVASPVSGRPWIAGRGTPVRFTVP